VSGFTAFSDYMRLQLENFTPEAAQKELVRVAKEKKVEVLSQWLTKPDVHIEADGHPAAREEEAKPYGVIVYRFTSLAEIAIFAIEQARLLSPIQSGKYRDSWMAMVNGVEADAATITGVSEVIVTNPRPYSRKIQSGARGFETYAGIVEKVRQIVFAEYGGNTGIIDANITFLNLRLSGRGYEVPWILRKGLRKIDKASGRRYGGIRNDAGAGMEISYPSLVISSRYPGR
jgi:hypothetical protein